MRSCIFHQSTSVLTILLLVHVLLQPILTSQLGPKLVKRPVLEASESLSDSSDSEFAEPEDPICSRAAFGHLPDASLCTAAILAMPMRIDHRDVAFQWGPPGSSGTDYETPQYFSAGKQDKCVISISNSPDVDEPDLSIWPALYAAATAIIQQCVIRQGVGGYIPYEGHDGNMAISVFSWDFRLNNPPPTARELENKIKFASRFSEASSQTQQQDTSADPPAKKQKTCSAGGNGYVKDAKSCCAGFEYTKQTFLDAAVQFGVMVSQALADAGNCLLSRMEEFA